MALPLPRFRPKPLVMPGSAQPPSKTPLAPRTPPPIPAAPVPSATTGNYGLDPAGGGGGGFSMDFGPPPAGAPASNMDTAFATGATAATKTNVDYQAPGTGSANKPLAMNLGGLAAPGPLTPPPAPGVGAQQSSGTPVATTTAATAAQADPEDYWKKAEQEYNDIMTGDAKAWGDQQHTLKGEMAGFQVRADSMNARMGGGIGGGSAGLAGAALGQGMQAYNAAAMDYNNRRRSTQLAWLDQQISHGQHLADQTFDIERSNAEHAGDVPTAAAASTYYQNHLAEVDPAHAAEAQDIYNKWMASGGTDADLEAQLAQLEGRPLHSAAAQTAKDRNKAAADAKANDRRGDFLGTSDKAKQAIKDKQSGRGNFLRRHFG